MWRRRRRRSLFRVVGEEEAEAEAEEDADFMDKANKQERQEQAELIRNLVRARRFQPNELGSGSSFPPPPPPPPAT